MNNFVYEEDPIIVCRDGDYPLLERLTPDNRKKAREKVKDPNYINSKYKIKEAFAGFGVIVNPEAMSYLYEVGVDLR
jgi:hypothetical protein